MFLHSFLIPNYGRNHSVNHRMNHSEHLSCRNIQRFDTNSSDQSLWAHCNWNFIECYDRPATLRRPRRDLSRIVLSLRSSRTIFKMSTFQNLCLAFKERLDKNEFAFLGLDFRMPRKRRALLSIAFQFSVLFVNAAFFIRPNSCFLIWHG